MFLKQTEKYRGIYNNWICTAKAGIVNLSIYDAIGRLVKQWNDKTSGQSNHITQQGTDEQRGEISNGICFVRLETGGKKINQKVILAK
ncbi:MAG: T9SS type A sorting domain-containing protein [candidate division WOR-3 bacterium]